MQAACQNPLSQPPAADRILVVRLGAMGDVVRTLPAFAALRDRYPAAHVAWLVEPRSEGVLHGLAGLDERIVFPRETLEDHWRQRRVLALARDVARFVVALRRRRFDLVLDFHGILKTGLLARASGAPLRVGYARPFAREFSSAFANRRVRVSPDRVSRFVRNAALIDFLGAGLPTAPCASAGRGAGWLVDPIRAARMRERLAEATRSGPGGGVAVIHPGSSERTPYKRYPVQHWAAVARGLREQGLACVVSAGGDRERELARAVVDASAAVGGPAAVLAPATPTPADLAALFAACRIFLGSDSGPLHLASLVGTPVVQVLGPTDPVENRPWPGTPARQVRVPVGCSPCRRGCAAATCMNVLPPAAVLAAAREMLADAQPEIASA